MAASWLESKSVAAQAAGSDTAAIWHALEQSYSRRLWHQLTIKLLEFVHHECFAAGTGLTELYENLIKDVEDRINPLSLVTIINVVITQITDAAAAIAFVEPVQRKIGHDALAITSLNTTVATLQMQLGELDKAKALLKECESKLEDVMGVTPVHAAYYRAFSALHKIEGCYELYYADALRYLGCVDMATLGVEESVVLAYELSLAALLGKGVYNMGELLSHGILESLKGTEKEWLVDLLAAFNAGDVAKFTALKPKWSAESQDLANSTAELTEKVRLLAVMEQVFVRQSKERCIGFAELATALHVAVDEVEVLVMKALSLGLVRGTIDQMEQVVTFTWVQPRVLDLPQLSNMHARLGEWLGKVNTATTMMTTTAPELLVGN